MKEYANLDWLRSSKFGGKTLLVPTDADIAALEKSANSSDPKEVAKIKKKLGALILAGYYDTPADFNASKSSKIRNMNGKLMDVNKVEGKKVVVGDGAELTKLETFVTYTKSKANGGEIPIDIAVWKTSALIDDSKFETAPLMNKTTRNFGEGNIRGSNESENKNVFEKIFNDQIDEFKSSSDGKANVFKSYLCAWCNKNKNADVMKLFGFVCSGVPSIDVHILFFSQYFRSSTKFEFSSSDKNSECYENCCDNKSGNSYDVSGRNGKDDFDDFVQLWTGKNEWGLSEEEAKIIVNLRYFIFYAVCILESESDNVKTKIEKVNMIRDNAEKRLFPLDVNGHKSFDLDGPASKLFTNDNVEIKELGKFVLYDKMVDICQKYKGGDDDDLHWLRDDKPSRQLHAAKRESDRTLSRSTINELKLYKAMYGDIPDDDL
jgi:hypothetical protein